MGPAELQVLQGMAAKWWQDVQHNHRKVARWNSGISESSCMVKCPFMPNLMRFEPVSAPIDMARFRTCTLGADRGFSPDHWATFRMFIGQVF